MSEDDVKNTDLEFQSWKNRIAEIDAIIHPLKMERMELKRKIVTSLSQFAIGDIIEWKSCSSNRKGRVIGIHEWTTNTPMWNVVRIRKDGTEGERCEVRPYMDPVLSKT